MYQIFQLILIILLYKIKNGLIKKSSPNVDSDFDNTAYEFPKLNYGHLFNMTSLEFLELFFY